MAGSKFLNIDKDTTLAGNSDSTVSSQKAVKTYVDTGLEGKINTSEKGAASGVATLDSNTKVPIAQVPHSTSTSLGDSNTVVPTQGAVKSYIDNNLIPKNFGGNVASTNPQAPVSAETYGTSAVPKGYFKNVNLLHTVKNYFYKADKNLYNSGTVTVTCSYDDVVSGLGVSMLNGSYDGYYTSINPKTDFPEKPFVWTILSSSSFEVSDVCNLFLTGHRLTGVVNATAYKLEVTSSYNSGTPTWYTLVDYSGSAVNLCQKHFRLYSPEISTSPGYHSICGVRLTISGSTSTVFELSQIMLLSSRGTENVSDGIHALDVGKGGKIVANVTIPTDKGSFIGNLTGNVTGNLNGIANKIATTSASYSINRPVLFTQNGDLNAVAYNNNFQYNPATGVLTVDSITGTADKATKDGDGNTISSTYIKTSTKGAANGVASLDANTKIPEAQIPDKFVRQNDILQNLNYHNTSARTRLWFSSLDDTFYRANRRHTVTLTNFDTDNATSLFDMNWDTNVRIDAGNIGTINISGATNLGMQYPYGYIYISFYGGNSPTSTSQISARVYQDWSGHNTGWVNLGSFEAVSTGTYSNIEHIKVARVKTELYGIKQVELSIDNTDGVGQKDTKIWVTQVEFFCNRTGVQSLPILTKLGGDTIYGTLTIPTSYGSFAGYLSGTAQKAEKDVDGNAIKTTYAKTSSLATVATSGSYNDLSNKPTIPTVNNATLTIQANGTQKGTFTANSATDTTINIQKSDFVTSKTFTGLIATEANEKNSTVYLVTINPTSWNAEWSVRYRLEVTLDDGATPTNYQYYNSQHECYLTGRQGVYTAYANFNSISSTDYRSIYYIKSQRTTEAGYNAGYGHKIGVEFQSSSNPTNTSYKRTIKVTILDAINCAVVLNDAPEVPVNSTRTDYTKLSSSYYTTSESNTAGNWVRFNGYTNGLQETGNANDNTYNQVMMSNNYLSNGSYNDTTALYIFNYNIIGFDKNGAALCISVPSTSATTASTALSTTRVYTTVGFDYVKGLMYTAQNTAYAGGADVNISPRLCHSGMDLRYSDNCLAASSANTLGLVNRKPIYLRGTIGNDGLFYLAPLEVTYNNTTYKRAWTQDLPSVEDNYVYWFIGYPYYNSSYPNSLYQVDFNPSRNVLEYKNGKYQPYMPPASVTVDGTTIVNSGAGVLSAQAVKNQNDTTTAVKTWVGTQDEYNALSSYDANTIYNIVDSEDSVSNIYQQPLLTSIWSDHKLNDPSWLRADTFSWQSGDIYKAVYNHLVQDVLDSIVTTLYSWNDGGEYTLTENPSVGDYVFGRGFTFLTDVEHVYSDGIITAVGANTITYTAAGSSYTVNRSSTPSVTGRFAIVTDQGNGLHALTSKDGHKLVLVSSYDTLINQIYNTTGVAWYYILDTENQRFKLPRTKYGFTGLRTNVGDYVSQEVLLPNITGTIPLSRSNHSLVTGSFYTASASDTLSNSGGSNDTYLGVLDASRASSIYSGDGTNTKIQPAATQMYLYFYVGSYARPAIIQTAGLNTESFNNKVDLDASNINNSGKSKIVNLMMPSATYTNLTLGASGASYIAPADGWVVLHATQTATNGYAFLRNTTGSELVSGQQPTQVSNFEIRLFIPIAKGQTAVVDYGNINVTVFRFVYAIGSTWEAN